MIEIRPIVVLSAIFFLTIISGENVKSLNTLKRDVNISSGNVRGFFDMWFGTRKKICNCKCGISNKGSRLVHGQDLEPFEFPWMVVVQIAEPIQGVLINDRYVLTAAGAVFRLSPFDVKVRLGAFDRCADDISSVNMSVDAIKVHPDYNNVTNTHDLALLRMSSYVAFNSRIKPICLPYNGMNYVGQVGIVAGWPHFGESCRLRKVGLPILDEPCFGTNWTDRGCLGVVGAPSVICRDDAGGAVQFRTKRGVYELIGILMNTNQCNDQETTITNPKIIGNAHKNKMATFTKIHGHVDWIVQNTSDGCYCQKTY